MPPRPPAFLAAAPLPGRRRAAGRALCARTRPGAAAAAAASRRAPRAAFPLPGEYAGDYPVLQERVVDAGGGVRVALRVEDLGGRRRRVSGGVDIEAGAERVWAVLTAYAAMGEYMPNIVSSEVEERDGVVYLDQVGVISRRLSLQSRMVMQVEERKGEWISFSRVEGRDFSEFEGRYWFREGQGEGGTLRLDYELYAVPMPLFPVALVERKIVKEVPAMLASVRDESLYGKVVPL